MSPVAVVLERTLRATCADLSEPASWTPHEIAFTRRYHPELRAALKAFRRQVTPAHWPIHSQHPEILPELLLVRERTNVQKIEKSMSERPKALDLSTGSVSLTSKLLTPKPYPNTSKP